MHADHDRTLPLQTDAPVALQTDAPVVRLDGVSRVYLAGSVRVPALTDVSLTIPPRRFCMVVGPSGSGKTTLLNLIGCIDRADAGRVEGCGQNVGEMSDDGLSDFRYRNIGFVFQSFNLIAVLSAYENIEYPLLMLGLP